MEDKVADRNTEINREVNSLEKTQEKQLLVQYKENRFMWFVSMICT